MLYRNIINNKLFIRRHKYGKLKYKLARWLHSLYASQFKKSIPIFNRHPAYTFCLENNDGENVPFDYRHQVGSFHHKLYILKECLFNRRMNPYFQALHTGRTRNIVKETKYTYI